MKKRNLIYLLVLMCAVIINTGFAEDEYEISEIYFAGTTFFTQDDLLDIIYSETGDDFDTRLVKLDKIVLMNYYRQSGFLTVEINDSLILNKITKEIEINYIIQENRRYYFGKVIFMGNNLISAGELNKTFAEYKSGEPFDEARINEGNRIIENDYYNHGKPYVNINLDYRFEQDSLVVVLFNIEENQTIYIKDVNYIGLELVQTFLVRRELEFKKGEIYNRRKLDQSQQNIYSTGLFEYVRFELEPIPNDTTNVILKILIRERDPRWIGFKIGFGYEQEESYGNKLDLTAEGGHRNIFGTARSISLHLVPSFLYDVNSKTIVNPENQISFVFVEPWIGYSRTPGVFQISYNQYRPLNSADFNVLRTSFNVSHKYKSGYEAAAGIEAKFVDQLTTGIIDSVLELDAGKDEIYSLSLFARNDTRKNFFNPANGSVTELGLSFSSSHGFSKFGVAENTQYITLIMSWKRFQPMALDFISKKLKFTFANRIKIGSIYEFGPEGSIPISDLFFAGGATTVRGYPEQLLGPLLHPSNDEPIALGGKLIFLANAEIRFPIIWLFMGELFIDGGNVWRENKDFRAKEIKFSVGAGIALMTPIGPIRFDYGFKLMKRYFEEPSNFHIGFYFAF